MSQRVPKVGNTARFSNPSVGENAMTFCVAADSCCNATRTSAAYTRPESVSTMRWRTRWNRAMPNCASNCRIWRDTALCVKCSSCAAREMLVCLAAASKASKSAMGGKNVFLNMCSQLLHVDAHLE